MLINSSCRDVCLRCLDSVGLRLGKVYLAAAHQEGKPSNLQGTVVTHPWATVSLSILQSLKR